MKGWRSLSPTSRHAQSVSLVAFFSASEPEAMTGLTSSMKTSHRSYCQNAYIAVVAWVNWYSSIAFTVDAMAWFSRLRIHLQLRLRSCGLISSGATYASPRFIMAYLRALKSLLHQCLYPTTLLTSRLTSRPWEV